MLSTSKEEAIADTVMEVIAHHERKMNTLGSTYSELDIAIIDHLYEMHKLRDEKLHAQLRGLLPIESDPDLLFRKSLNQMQTY